MAKAKTFTQMMDELTEITATIERGELPLEEMMKLYKRGMKLAGSCRAKITAAEESVRMDMPEQEIKE